MAFDVWRQHARGRLRRAVTGATRIKHANLGSPRRQFLGNRDADDACADDRDLHQPIVPKDTGAEVNAIWGTLSRAPPMPERRVQLRRVCVFCGSSRGNRPAYHAAATTLAKAMAARRIELVFGGGGIGLMTTIADAILAAGGHAIGVIPEALRTREVAHQGLEDLRVVKTMHARKALMAELSDAFIALPGGFGTFEEFCEVVTWTQLGVHRKRCGLLNIDGFYDPLLGLFDHAVEEGFVKPDDRAIVVAEIDPNTLLDRLSIGTRETEPWIPQTGIT
jgi:uncharacterized protein (TIGR00730 family)